MTKTSNDADKIRDTLSGNGFTCRYTAAQPKNSQMKFTVWTDVLGKQLLLLQEYPTGGAEVYARLASGNGVKAEIAAIRKLANPDL